MMIRLVDPDTDLEFAIDAAMIFVCIRNPQNKLVSIVVTKASTQQGPVAYSVKESPLDVMEMVNAALAATDKRVLM